MNGYRYFIASFPRHQYLWTDYWHNGAWFSLRDHQRNAFAAAWHAGLWKARR
jgi:hypothetical protein